MDAREYMKKVKKSKEAYRKMLSNLPIEEKIRIVEELMERAILLHKVRTQEKNTFRH